MNALVLYDSKYGNTERIAEAIALLLQEALPTRLAAIDEVEDCAETLVASTCSWSAARRTGTGSATTLREVVARLGDDALGGIRAAAFDTRVRGAKIVTGSAAVRLAGWCAITAPGSSSRRQASSCGACGPAPRGELERARAWTRRCSRPSASARAGAREPVAG